MEIIKLLKRRRTGYKTLIREGVQNAKQPFYIMSTSPHNAQCLVKEFKNKKAIPVTFKDIPYLIDSKTPIIIDNELMVEILESHEELFKTYENKYKFLHDRHMDLVASHFNLTEEINRLKKLSFWKQLFNFKKY